jgi:uncharacterized surface protein with fasciclin (FAS1) repeats
MKMNIKTLVLGLSLGAFALSGCEDYSSKAPSIANIAVSNPAFSTLEGAAVLGGVAGVLSNDNPNDANGNYTVFAPTNDAFAKLGLVNEGSLGVLNQAFLTNTLLYHVSNGSLTKSTITTGQSTPSLLNVSRKYIARGSDTYINGSKIVATDVMADNGIVHVIDKVLLGVNADIVQTALALKNAQVFKNAELTFLVEAVLYTELAAALTASAGSPSFTVYAPTDAAFKQLGRDLGVTLNVAADIRTLPKETVRQVLLNHVINNGGKFTAEVSGTSETPLGGTALTYGAFTNGTYTVQGRNGRTANMVIPDVKVANGIVHVIDQVLVP